MEMRPKPELKDFVETIRMGLPYDMDPLLVIKECGCDNDYFALTEDAKKIICKYCYCPYQKVCKEGS